MIWEQRVEFHFFPNFSKQPNKNKGNGHTFQDNMFHIWENYDTLFTQHSSKFSVRKEHLSQYK